LLFKISTKSLTGSSKH